MLSVESGFSRHSDEKERMNRRPSRSVVDETSANNSGDQQRTSLTRSVTPKRTRGLAPDRGLTKQWSKCSLCSIDSVDVDDETNLPIPGRESHTADIDYFLFYIKQVNMQPRFPNDYPFSARFWVYIKDVLSTATNVGYSEHTDADEVEIKGPKDNQEFLEKIMSTSLINPIDPVRLSQESGIPLDEVLTELLYGVLVNMVKMRWSPDCERVKEGGAFCAHPSNSSIKRLNSRRSYCSGCTYKNAIQVLSKIKVVFIFNPDIFFALSESFDCRPALQASTEFFAVVPATFTGSGFRYCLGCGGDENKMRPPLSAGKYRLYCPVSCSVSYLQVKRDAQDEDEPHTLRLHVSDTIGWRGDKIKVLKAPHGRIQLDIFTDTHSFYVCWIQRDEDAPQDGDGPDNSQLHATQDFLTAQRLMSNPAYQNFVEGTEVETEHFNSAVRRMKLTSNNRIPGGHEPTSPALPASQNVSADSSIVAGEQVTPDLSEALESEYDEDNGNDVAGAPSEGESSARKGSQNTDEPKLPEEVEGESTSGSSVKSGRLCRSSSDRSLTAMQLLDKLEGIALADQDSVDSIHSFLHDYEEEDSNDDRAPTYHDIAASKTGGVDRTDDSNEIADLHRSDATLLTGRAYIFGDDADEMEPNAISSHQPNEVDPVNEMAGAASKTIVNPPEIPAAEEPPKGKEEQNEEEQDVEPPLRVVETNPDEGAEENKGKERKVFIVNPETIRRIEKKGRARHDSDGSCCDWSTVSSASSYSC